MDEAARQRAREVVNTPELRQADRQFFGGVLEQNPAYLLPLQR